MACAYDTLMRTSTVLALTCLHVWLSLSPAVVGTDVGVYIIFCGDLLIPALMQ